MRPQTCIYKSLVWQTALLSMAIANIRLLQGFTCLEWKDVMGGGSVVLEDIFTVKFWICIIVIMDCFRRCIYQPLPV